MPTVTVPDTLWTPDDTALAVSGITVADPDAGTSALEITLDADQGTMTLGSTAGLTFTDGTGTGDASMTFTGTLADIGTALAGLTYTPDTGYHGAGGITVWADDQGNTGAGGSLADFGVLTVAVGGPVVAVDAMADDGTEDTASVIDVLADDVWVGESTPALTVSTAPAHGTAVVGDDGIEYTPAAEWYGTDTFSYTLNDGLGHTDTATVTVTVAQVNDAAIATSGDPNMYADEGELVDDTFTTPDATESVTWAASGLPVGLSINPATGEITGRPHYDQAGAHPFSLTATAAGGDTDTVGLTWNVADVNRIPWIDDQVTQEHQSANINFYAVDNFGNQLTYSFSGLPAGTGGPNDTGGHAGEYGVTIYVTGGGATDSRSYHWKIVPAAVPIGMGTPAAGVATFALNGTQVHADDVGLVGLPMPLRAKLFLTEWDYFHIGNNSLSPIMLQVVTGDAGLTTDPNDTQGSTTIVVTPTQSVSATEAIVDAYLVGRSPSMTPDDVMVVAYRMVNNAWVEMDGAGTDNNLEIKYGTHLDDDGLPDHLWDGIVDANTTPAAMWRNNKDLYRIPPRNYNAADLWVTKTGVIGGKNLYLAAPFAAKGTMGGQSKDNGEVMLSDGSGFSDDNWWVWLTDNMFNAPTNEGEQTAKIWI
jgi:hypothetical protein